MTDVQGYSLHSRLQDNPALPGRCGLNIISARY
jgi:hypothetical protein